MGSGRNALLACAMATAGLAASYTPGGARVDPSRFRQVESRLTDLGEVDSVSILPLVERLSRTAPPRCESGGSYLMRINDTVLLFDCGLCTGNPTSALVLNVEVLSVGWGHQRSDKAAGKVTRYTNKPFSTPGWSTLACFS
jgi:hypothetical protein